MDFRTWIEAKTPETLHNVCGWEIGTIRVWRHRNCIPRNHWPELLSNYPEVGLNDLKKWESLARARKALGK